MRYDNAQFAPLDTLDDRREIMTLLGRLGSDEARRDFLLELITLSGNGFASKMCSVEPCNAVTAYFYFGAITGCLGVNINTAALLLERRMRKGERDDRRATVGRT